jgi:hypothetical protein
MSVNPKMLYEPQPFSKNIPKIQDSLNQRGEVYYILQIYLSLNILFDLYFAIKL